MGERGIAEYTESVLAAMKRLYTEVAAFQRDLYALEDTVRRNAYRAAQRDLLLAVLLVVLALAEITSVAGWLR